MRNTFTQVFIPEEQYNYGITPAGRLGVFDQRQLQREIEDEEGIWMNADNLSHGCGGAAIQFTLSGFNPSAFTGQNDDPNVLLQLTVNKETLHEIIDALKIIYDDLEDGEDS